MDNANISIYDAIQDRLDVFRQGDEALDKALNKIDNLYALLPAKIKPSNPAMVPNLRKQLSKLYADKVSILQLANPNITYKGTFTRYQIGIANTTIERDNN